MAKNHIEVKNMIGIIISFVIGGLFGMILMACLVASKGE